MVDKGKWRARLPNFICPMRAGETKMAYQRRNTQEAEDFAISFISQGCCGFKAVLVQESDSQSLRGKINEFKSIASTFRQ